MTPTFHDDFTSLDFTRWLTRWWYVDPKAAGCSLPSNGELQLYVNHDGPLHIVPWTPVDSVLFLTCDREPVDGVGSPAYSYTSGMINTHDSFSQLYGYFECRAKLPAGSGLWPAFWLLPVNGAWPPEIDIFEWLGRDPSTLNVGVHSGPANDKGTGAQVHLNFDPTADFHLYAVEWTADNLTWYVDDAEVFTCRTPNDCHVPMYLILDLALGGPWAGPPNNTTLFPAALQIDYVTVWPSRPTLEPSMSLTIPIQTPWGSVVISNFNPGDTLTFPFPYDELSFIFDGKDTHVWVRQGGNLTRAAIVEGHCLGSVK